MKPYLITVYASLCDVESLDARYAALLSAYRMEKCVRIKDETERMRGRLAEYCLIEAVRRVDSVHQLPLCIQTDENGKPYLQDSAIRISLSHAGEYAVAAISNEPVGVDVERLRPNTERLAKRICTPTEWQTVWLSDPTPMTFLKLFSAKECAVKQTGRGIRDLQKVDITQRTDIRQRVYSDYVMSVCASVSCEWEVYPCVDTNTKFGF